MTGGFDVSVITIFRDEERYLTDAIESVLAQDGCRWELLLVDDGSTDASPGIARHFVACEPERIRYLRHPDGRNHGMSATRNLGIAAATGRWLTFLDADDVWRPGKLAAQLDALARHPTVEVLVSPAEWWYRHDGESDAPDDWRQTLRPASVGAPGIESTWPHAGEVVAAPPTLLTGFLDDEWRSICDLVISRCLVDLVGGYEPEFRGMYEDQVFHAKVLASRPAVVTDGSWYRYRQHAEACTAVSHGAGSHLRARRRFLDWLGDHLAEAERGEPGMVDPVLAALVRSHRRRIRRRPLARMARSLQAVGRRALTVRING